eukprot:3595769-Pyramimonas_sp.AAC.1
MALGRARTVSDDYVHRSWTTKRVFEYWSMAPTSVELLARRLPWWQDIVKEPSHHSHLLAAVLGQCTFERTVGAGRA